MRWIPKVTYGTPATEVTYTYPQKCWDPERPSVGGIDWSATGVPAGYVIHRDGDLKAVFRVTEAEVPATLAWLEAAQEGQSFSVWLDATTGAPVTAYLVSPTAGEKIQFPRSQQYPRVFELSLTLRRVDGAAWVVPFYP